MTRSCIIAIEWRRHQEQRQSRDWPPATGAARATQLLDEAGWAGRSRPARSPSGGVRARRLPHFGSSRHARRRRQPRFKEFLRSRRTAARTATRSRHSRRLGQPRRVRAGVPRRLRAHLVRHVKPGVPCASPGRPGTSAKAPSPPRFSGGCRVACEAARESSRLLRRHATLIQQPRNRARSRPVREGMARERARLDQRRADGDGGSHTPDARQALESVAATIDDANTLTTGERTRCANSLRVLPMTSSRPPSPAAPRAEATRDRPRLAASLLIERVRAIRRATSAPTATSSARARLSGESSRPITIFPHRVVRADGNSSQGQPQRKLLRAEVSQCAATGVDLDQARSHRSSNLAFTSLQAAITESPHRSTGIHGRLRTTVGEALTPETLAAIPDPALPRRRSVREQARLLRDLFPPNPRRNSRLTQTSRPATRNLIHGACHVRGIGRWTAEMLPRVPAAPPRRIGPSPTSASPRLYALAWQLEPARPRNNTTTAAIASDLPLGSSPATAGQPSPAPTGSTSPHSADRPANIHQPRRTHAHQPPRRDLALLRTDKPIATSNRSSALRTTTHSHRRRQEPPRHGRDPGLDNMASLEITYTTEYHGHKALGPDRLPRHRTPDRQLPGGTADLKWDSASPATHHAAHHRPHSAPPNNALTPNHARARTGLADPHLAAAPLWNDSGGHLPSAATN